MPLIAEDFTWDFLFSSVSAWPMTHILNPFTIQMMFQNVYWTFLAIFAWESIEVLAVVLFNGQYVIFVGDDSEIESITDSLIGDVINGILGILLAKLTILAFKIPSWTPSFFGKYRSILIKRMLFFVVWVLTLSSANLRTSTDTEYDANIGVMIIFITTSLLIYISYISNRTLLENLTIWKDKYTPREYELIYIGWFINASLLVSSAWVHFWYSYFVCWVYVSIGVFFNIVYMILNGRLWEISFWLNFGFLKYPHYENQLYFNSFKKTDSL